MTDVDVREILQTVDDPELGTDIVSLGLVTDVAVEDNVVSVSLALGAPHAPVDTGGCTFVQIFATPGWRITSVCYSHQY